METACPCRADGHGRRDEDVLEVKTCFLLGKYDCRFSVGSSLLHCGRFAGKSNIVCGIFDTEL